MVNNGAYNTRAVEVCQMYHIPHIDLKSSVFEQPNLADVEKTLKRIRWLWFTAAITRRVLVCESHPVRLELWLTSMELS